MPGLTEHASPESGAPSRARQAVSFLSIALLMAVTYYLAARAGLAMLDDAGVAVFWPASGIAVGVLLAAGRTSIGPVALGVAAATITANVVAGRPHFLSFSFAIANAVECSTVAWLVHSFLGARLQFDSLLRVLCVFLAAIIGSGLGSALATLALYLTDRSWTSWGDDWHVWFRSDLIGIVALSPLIVGLRTLFTTRATWQDNLEGVALTGFLVATAYVIGPSGFQMSASGFNLPIALIFPPLLLLAIRHPLTYSPIGASAVALVFVGSIIAEQVGTASFRIFNAQLTIFSLIGCSLSLSALIAERRTAETRQTLMVRELNHRVKNALTVVQAVVERSREGTSSMGDFYAALGGRIRSMARTHSLLSRERWHGLELEELVAAELAPFQVSDAHTVHGPRVMLGPSLAQSLNLVLHELSTNAAKYGALSQPGGTVAVTWAVEETGPNVADTLVITWKETCPAALRDIGPEGFGLATIRELLQYETEGTVDLTFPPTGALCVIRLPLSEPGVSLA
ncbi:sensor histidine kinase [Hyphomicrobium sp.]|uniref:sensor histidine kinase n=1 Tax=Hyphomicrobium sp. TaxID=82 RepID=UPI003F6F0A08